MFQLHSPMLRLVRGVAAMSLYELAEKAEPLLRQPANKDWQTVPWPISYRTSEQQEWTGTGFILKDGLITEVEL